MKKTFLLILCFIMIFSFVSCKSHGTGRMSKWSNDKFELYCLDNSDGILTYEDNGRKYVFDICFKYGDYLYIYEHREDGADTVELVARYDGLVCLNPNKCKYSLRGVFKDSYEDIFDSRIILKCKQNNITASDLPYALIYGDPVKQNVSCLECHENGADIKLHITEDVENSYLEIIYDNSNVVSTFDVTFDTQGKITLISRDDNSKRSEYYVYQRCNDYIAKIVDSTQKIHDLPNIIYFEKVIKR